MFKKFLPTRRGVLPRGSIVTINKSGAVYFNQSALDQLQHSPEKSYLHISVMSTDPTFKPDGEKEVRHVLYVAEATEGMGYRVQRSKTGGGGFTCKRLIEESPLFVGTYRIDTAFTVSGDIAYFKLIRIS